MFPSHADSADIKKTIVCSYSGSYISPCPPDLTFNILGSSNQLTAVKEEVWGDRLFVVVLISPFCSSKIQKMTFFFPSQIQVFVLCMQQLSFLYLPLCLCVSLHSFYLHSILLESYRIRALSSEDWVVSHIGSTLFWGHCHWRQYFFFFVASNITLPAALHRVPVAGAHFLLSTSVSQNFTVCSWEWPRDTHTKRERERKRELREEKR